MVKGQTYSEQVFESSSFRHFINTFLAGESGITKGCEIVQATTSIDIKPGYFIVMGGLLKEEGTSNIIPGEAGYYKLVYEVDLSQSNTDTEFNQGNYKFLKGIGLYPSLTQEDLDNSGNVYQFEFCQFRVTESGIQDFEDKRAFLDFDSIYEEVREKITEIEDGSMITESINELRNELKSQINGLASGSPLVASSIEEMIDTTKTYVNTTDGNWYYYDSTTWKTGGVYQATEIADGSITPLKTDFFEYGKNRFDGIFFDGYINLNGVVDSTDTNYKHTSMIYVKGLSSIIFGALSSDGVNRSGRTARFITAYDSNKNVIPSAGMENLSGGEAYNIINNVAYVVYTFSSTDEFNEAMAESGTEITDYEEYKEIIKPKHIELTNILAYKLKGKKIACFGDSIMQGNENNYNAVGEILAQKYGMNLYQYATGGATVGYFDASHSWILDQINKAHSTDNIPAPDIILIDGGTNDVNGYPEVPNVELGIISDTFVTSELPNGNTFSGSLERILFNLQHWYPDAIIIFVRVHNMSSRDYEGQKLYGQRAIDLCNKWGVKVINIFNILNTNIEEKRIEFLVDETHPNDDGYNKFYIPQIESALIDML